MIIRRLDEARGGPREVVGGNWTSTRLLLREDAMGFSMHDTTLRAGTSTEMHYVNHLEAVYCIEGEAVLKELPDGPEHVIVPGTLYALDKHDHHLLTVRRDLRVICVFNPPCTGREVHDERGAYPLLPDEEPAAG